MPWTKAYTREYNRAWVKAHRAQVLRNCSVYARSVKGRFCNLRSTAKRRGLKVSITLEQYTKIVASGKCFYCGLALSPTGYGLDRIRPNRGYERGNLRPCCSCCNRMKSALYDKEFFRQIRLIYHHKYLGM